MIGKRLAIRGLEALCRMMWGFPPTIITLVVDAMGPMRAIGWFAAHMPRFLTSRVVLGPVRVHLACIVVSLRNGCAYCAYGHVYALELLYLRQHGRLFPLDAKALDAWYGLDARALRNRLRSVLAAAGMHTEAIWVDRIIELAEGSQTPVDAAETRLAHVIRMGRHGESHRRGEGRSAGRGTRPGQQGRRDQGPPRRAEGSGADLSCARAGQMSRRQSRLAHVRDTIRGRHPCNWVESSPRDTPWTRKPRRARHLSPRSPPSRGLRSKPRSSRYGPDRWPGGPPAARPSTPNSRWQASSWRTRCCPPTAAARDSAG